jgi:DndB-like DNA-sulfur modification-associated protein
MSDILREGVQQIAGVPTNDKRFQARMRFSTLRHMIRDPRELEANHEKRDQDRDPDLEAIYQIRETAQRAVKGKKRENIASYAHFIEHLYADPEIGCTPAIHLWSETPFQYIDGGLSGPSYIEIDNDATVVILDGETQYMARLNASSHIPDIRSEMIPVEIHHGRSRRWAGESFYCMNVLGVTASPNTSMSMHKSDPLVQMVYTLQQTLPVFREPQAITAGGRGLAKGSIVLFNVLRQAVGAFFLGRKATQIGAKDISEEDTAQLTPERMDACAHWFRLVTETLEPEYKGGKTKTMAVQAPVWVALGLYGHEALGRGTIAAGALDELAELRAINWNRGAHWLNIGLSYSAKGSLSVANIKGYAVPTYEAISPDGFADARRKNPDLPNYYQQIRTREVLQAA